jgi:hypothetical protein
LVNCFSNTSSRMLAIYRLLSKRAKKNIFVESRNRFEKHGKVNWKPRISILCAPPQLTPLWSRQISTSLIKRTNLIVGNRPYQEFIGRKHSTLMKTHSFSLR